ncbi:carbonic anhydrase 2 [Scaptodrosophila lebanonensis]|uniref:Carbonic anhydrase n=1 Tax=Drosophila lebanonensis TaxID=7225 RepID=A0A6J2TMG8_DROLE|nr:carbonic anhydrase 2 [Scaptodrosophila lebanonensis]
MDIPETVNGGRPTITGGLLKSKYVAEGLHFHWGSPTTRGSEHIISRRQYDVEMHIVHRNIRYATVSEAAQYSDGLAVLGIMFKIANYPSKFYPGLSRVFAQIPNVIEYDSTAQVSGSITLGQLLGDLNTADFFTYKGSLTVPDCHEAVTWTVFPHALPLPYEFVSTFWNMRDSNGDVLTDTFRLTQPRNNRAVVYRTTKDLSNIFLG